MIGFLWLAILSQGIFMKKTLLASLLATICTPVFALDLQANTIGKAGAGISTGNYSEGVINNPSLGAAYDPEKDDFAIILSGGALLFDKDNLIDKVDELVDLTDSIQNSTVFNQSQATELKNRLAEIDEKQLMFNVSGSAVISIPNHLASIALVSKVQADGILLPDVSDEDFEIIDDAINGYFDPSDEINGLSSSVEVLGALTTELGVSFSKSFSLAENNYLLIGVKPKRVEIESYIYETTVADYDEDDFDSEQYSYTESVNSIDVGATYIQGKWRYGLVVNNLQEKSVATIDPDFKLTLKRQIVSSVGYAGEKWNAEVALDLNSAPALIFAKDSRLMRAGAEYSISSLFRLRAGLQRDLESVIPDYYTVGFSVGTLSLAYMTGSNNTQGVSLGFGLRF
jgi:hypothetical protein